MSKSSENIKINTYEMLMKLLEEGVELNKRHKELVIKIKKITKLHFKVCKDLEKNKIKNKKTKRAPSGFAKPTVISNNLCDFLGIKHGELMARTEVTKRITSYIRNNKLQVLSNKRQFLPDNKLSKILSPLDSNKKDKNGLTDSQKGYTYFNLQKYLSPQFPKITKI
jgi:chromatin remodeling complex protein RSC6